MLFVEEGEELGFLSGGRGLLLLLLLWLNWMSCGGDGGLGEGGRRVLVVFEDVRGSVLGVW